MSLKDQTAMEGELEECMHEIGEFVATLDRYPPTTVAVVLSVHLQTMLSALVQCGLCTPQQVTDFVQELERDVSADLMCPTPP